MDRPRRPVPWAVAVVYGAVLVGGVYWSLIGEDLARPGRLATFALVFALLLAIEVVEWRRPPGVAAAAALLAVRAVLFAAAALLDGSGTSRALFVLVPFVAYFAFGRATSVVL